MVRPEVADQVLRSLDFPGPTFFFKLIFIGVWLLYNVVLVAAVEQSESVTRILIYPLFWISFPLRSPQSAE